MDNLDILFFDLDHTLIDTDCEWAWKNILADIGLVTDSQRARQDNYIKLHAEGKTPAEEYLNFLSLDFVGKTTDEMSRLAQRNFDTNICHKFFPKASTKLKAFCQLAGNQFSCPDHSGRSWTSWLHTLDSTKSGVTSWRLSGENSPAGSTVIFASGKEN